MCHHCILNVYISDRKTNQGATIEFPVIQIASLNRWDAGVVKRELKNLQWTTYEGPQSQGTLDSPLEYISGIFVLDIGYMDFGQFQSFKKISKLLLFFSEAVWSTCRI